MNDVSPTQQATPLLHSRLVLVACLIGSLWIGLLAWLAFTTANPATLNWRQIAVADMVIVAEVVDAAAGQVRVKSLFFPGDQREDLQSEQLLTIPTHDTIWKNSQLRILPLRQPQTSTSPWQIFPAPLPGEPLLDYPATPEFLLQLQNFDKAEFLQHWEQLQKLTDQD